MADSRPPTITEFLLARIAEDEAAAEKAVHWNDFIAALGGGVIAQFALRQSPRRVLAECKAKRAIIELHGGDHECSTYDHHGEVDNCTWVLGGDCSTMEVLAAVYADHPDYQPEWAV